MPPRFTASLQLSSGRHQHLARVLPASDGREQRRDGPPERQRPAPAQDHSGLVPLLQVFRRLQRDGLVAGREDGRGKLAQVLIRPASV